MDIEEPKALASARFSCSCGDCGESAIFGLMTAAVSRQHQFVAGKSLTQFMQVFDDDPRGFHGVMPYRDWRMVSWTVARA